MSSPKPLSASALPECRISEFTTKSRVQNSEHSEYHSLEDCERSKPIPAMRRSTLDTGKKKADRRRLLDIVGPFQGPLCTLEDGQAQAIESRPTSPTIIERSKSSQGHYVDGFNSFPISRWLCETATMKNDPRLRGNAKNRADFELLATRFQNLRAVEGDKRKKSHSIAARRTRMDYTRQPTNPQQAGSQEGEGAMEVQFSSQIIDQVPETDKGDTVSKGTKADGYQKDQLEQETAPKHMIESVSTMPDDYEEHEQSDTTISFSSDSESENSDNESVPQLHGTRRVSIESDSSFVVLDFADTTRSHSCTENSGSDQKGKGKVPVTRGIRRSSAADRDGQESDGGYNSNGEGRDRKRRRGNEGNTSQEDDRGEVRKFICPYYSSDPENPAHARCKSRAFPTIARVKGHVLRTHLKPLQCEKCCVYRAGDHGQISKHLQKNTCTPGRFLPMDPEIVRKGKALSRAGRIKTWKEVCMLIFGSVPPAYPDEKESRQPTAIIQSPRDEPLDTLVNDTKFHTFVQDHLSRALSTLLPNLISQQLPTLISEYYKSQKTGSVESGSNSDSFIQSSMANSIDAQSASPEEVNNDYELVDNMDGGGYLDPNQALGASAAQPLPATTYSAPVPPAATELPPAPPFLTEYWETHTAPSLDGALGFDMNMDMDLGLFGGWEMQENN